MSLETTILSNLIYSERYTRKVLPFLKVDYFQERSHKIIFLEIHEYVNQYDALPSLNAISIECQERTDLNEDQFKQIIEVLNELSNDPADHDWLVDTTETWCQERAIYLSLMESVKIADGQDSKRDKGAIPQILSEALGVSFDQHVGHDYVSDAQARYDFYHRKEDKIPFDLEFFNKITKGGLPNKTLNIALAGTGVGKSLFMCHVASSALLQGKNVLYITMEMAEEKIAERIDANLLNVPIQKLADLPHQIFDKKIQALSKKTQGKQLLKSIQLLLHMSDILSLLFLILLLSGLLDPILSLWITSISVLPKDIKGALSTLTPMSKQSLKSFVVSRANATFLLSVLRKPPVQVTVALMLTLLTLLNPLVSLLLLILCLPLLARRS